MVRQFIELGQQVNAIISVNFKDYKRFLYDHWDQRPDINQDNLIQKTHSNYIWWKNVLIPKSYLILIVELYQTIQQIQKQILNKLSNQKYKTLKSNTVKLINKLQNSNIVQSGQTCMESYKIYIVELENIILKIRNQYNKIKQEKKQNCKNYYLYTIESENEINQKTNTEITNFVEIKNITNNQENQDKNDSFTRFFDEYDLNDSNYIKSSENKQQDYNNQVCNDFELKNYTNESLTTSDNSSKQTNLEYEKQNSLSSQKFEQFSTIFQRQNNYQTSQLKKEGYILQQKKDTNLDQNTGKSLYNFPTTKFKINPQKKENKQNNNNNELNLWQVCQQNQNSFKIKQVNFNILNSQHQDNNNISKQQMQQKDIDKQNINLSILSHQSSDSNFSENDIWEFSHKIDDENQVQLPKQLKISKF
ncbi:hypothetical protein PPERSA_02096 [Pseudocohnilembus persalinus]|uniref:Uncharacterized protein n=1 Tax=Pseudocohnilembus persalinus TaxID=266149 RepID=A0A0V0Q824_PSEPJ|nr:hypothetical protein PPERSA_02096 [Pseudocohnilembus persalinus]|eukprot:KRW98319.1 hypothetical protein PPERSA_02096 [Pseudocohnilembus persalinus]